MIGINSRWLSNARMAKIFLLNQVFAEALIYVSPRARGFINMSARRGALSGEVYRTRWHRATRDARISRADKRDG